MNESEDRSSNNPLELIVSQLVPVLDTAAYAAGDTLFTTTKVPGHFRSGYIRQIVIIDKDDAVNESATLYFFNSNVTWGAFNVVPAISDGDADDLLGVSGAVVATTDLGGVKVGFLAVNIPFECSTSGALYVAATTATSLTHTASGLVFNIAIERWI